ncbi:DJ-1/PfpI family protein [Williamsia limnetica]|jgi:putative intracellular protease/amidase|uniref:DJ-1/PfpI family protein n=1 Tax=Williamsia limnetica TaxID=882452 RepID=A0A318RWZ4_WILLI|nr:DJ-1/PfpI family protein [Williamsia limnetica]PYE21153.1 DJ-1/PfpI family protein [Williamsia limnetica]
MTSATEPLTVHLAVYNTLADWETGHAVAHINNPEYQTRPGRYRVRTVGPTTEPITTTGGLRIVPDIALPDLDPQNSAMLILPGAADYMTGGLTEFIDAAAGFLDAGVPVAGICGATVAMAHRGLLDGRRHTSNAAEALSWTGYSGAADYVDEPAVTDRSRSGHLITAAAMHPVPFAREIFAELDLYSPETLAAWTKLYSGDPAGYHELMAANS